MKKNIFLSILFISAALNVFAQNSLNRFIHKYRRGENADYVNIGRLPMMLVRPFIDKDQDDDMQVLKKIHSVEVLDFDIHPEQTQVHHDMARLKSDLVKDGYEQLMFVKSDGDKVHILGKIVNDNLVRDCVLLVDNSDEISVIHVTGKIRLDEVGSLSGKFGRAKFDVTRK